MQKRQQKKVEAQSLAEQVRTRLIMLGIETPHKRSIQTPELSQVVIRSRFKDIMESLHLDLRDDSLKKTPERVAKMYAQELFYGLDYANFPEISTFENKMRYDEMITESCSVHSTCEHHFVPFIGICHIAYIPKTKVLGLSKFNRIVDFFSRRPQIQERLTEQVSATLRLVLDTEDVAVVIKATHYCVKIRGVKDGQSETVTSKITGRFKTKPALRQEFLALTRDSH